MSALSSAAAQAAEVIAPACWALGAEGNCCPEPPFEMPCPERRGVLERRDGVFLHFCVECGRWGAYGYGATGARPGLWYCRKHRPVE
jgi:hypothetical protein